MGRSDVRNHISKPGIASFSYNILYELQEAAIARGISEEELAAMPGIRLWLIDNQTMSKCDLIAWFRLHQQIAHVSQDLQNRHMDKQRAKQKGKQSASSSRRFRR